MARIPRWTAIAIVPLEFVIVLVLAPYAISRLSVRYGWVDGRPGPWNLLAPVLVAVGTAGIAWAVELHVAEMGPSVEIESAPKYLLKGGPYRFSRNPIYLAVLTTWLGWMLVYGSISISVVLLITWAVITFIAVPWEERRLERRFGEGYRQYKSAVPRWFGRVRV